MLKKGNLPQLEQKHTHYGAFAPQASFVCFERFRTGGSQRETGRDEFSERPALVAEGIHNRRLGGESNAVFDAPLLMSKKDGNPDPTHTDVSPTGNETPLLSVEEGVGPARVSIEKNRPARLKSLDTFRGISLTLMIFVNYGGVTGG